MLELVVRLGYAGAGGGAEAGAGARAEAGVRAGIQELNTAL